MSNNNLYRFAGWSAYVSAGATIFGFITLITFFMAGEPFGTMNDVSSVFISLSALPVLLALHQLHRSAAPTGSFIALIIGVLGALSAAVFQIIFIVTRKTYGDSVTLFYGVFGLSLAMYSYLALTDKVLPRGLAWFGIVAGIGYILVNTGFILGGENHPLTYIGGLASIIGYPTWAIWLGRQLLSRY